MLMLLLHVCVDAVALIFLLKVVNEDDIELGSAFLFALVAAFGAGILAMGLTSIMGIFGLILAAIIAAAILGVAVSAVYGVEIKRSFLIGGVFLLVHMGVGFFFRLLWGL